MGEHARGRSRRASRPRSRRGSPSAAIRSRARPCSSGRTANGYGTTRPTGAGELAGHAARFRDHLKLAGVKRATLHEQTAERMRVRLHDLRATFITIALANGKSETFVADRTGHRLSIMINRYRRAARTAAELGLGELTRLDLAIPELAPTKPAAPKGLEWAPEWAALRGDDPEAGDDPPPGRIKESLRNEHRRKRTGIEPAQDSEAAPHRF